MRPRRPASEARSARRRSPGPRRRSPSSRRAWPRLGRVPLLIATTATALGAASCAESEGPELLVSAASDLRFAFAELGEAFERESGIRVTFNFGSSGHLARQIERGAPADVFASADVAFLDELLTLGLILPDTRALYARGFLVLWALDEGPFRFGSLEDVAQPGVRRIAIANPDHAPYGIAARVALQSAGLWEAAVPRLVLGEDVNQTFQYAQTGNVDAAIVALSLALAPGAGNGRFVRIPEELHSPIDQALGVVASTRYEPEARAFARFATGPVGREILERYGFAVPDRPDGVERPEGP